MTQFEYKVVPAPRKGRKSKGVKTNDARFSLALQDVMNEHGAAGWEYLRAETLPSDERQGLTGTQTVYRDVLVFRRARAVAQDPVIPVVIEPQPVKEPEIIPDPVPDPEPEFESTRDSTDSPADTASAWEDTQTDDPDAPSRPA
jgi:hypothetical protein